MNYASNSVQCTIWNNLEYCKVNETICVLNPREGEKMLAFYRFSLAESSFKLFNGAGQAYHQELGPNCAILEIMLPCRLCKGCHPEEKIRKL